MLLNPSQLQGNSENRYQLSRGLLPPHTPSLALSALNVCLIKPHSPPPFYLPMKLKMLPTTRLGALPGTWHLSLDSHHSALLKITESSLLYVEVIKKP